MIRAGNWQALRNENKVAATAGAQALCKLHAELTADTSASANTRLATNTRDADATGRRIGRRATRIRRHWIVR